MVDINRQFIKYVSLNILSMLGVSFYILIDTYFIAKGCGSEGLAALNIAIPAYGAMTGIGYMVGIGSATRFKIHFEEREKKCIIFTKGLIIVGAISFIFFLAGLFFSNKIAFLLGGRGEVLVLADLYMKIILMFTPAFMFDSLFICFVRNDNNPSLAMKAVFLGSFFNGIFDYVLIIALNLGMFGAALATGIAPILSLIILSTHFIQGKNTFGIKKTLVGMKDFFMVSSLGIASLINELSSSVVIIVYNLILLKYSGNIGVAAYGVIANIALVVVAIFNGIGQGTQPLISENYAKKSWENIHFIIKKGILWGIVASFIFYVYMYFRAGFITDLFNTQEDMILNDMAIEGIRIYFLGMPFACMNVVVATSMQAMEKPRISFFIAILRGIVVIIPLAIFLSNLYQVKGMWYSYLATEGLVSVASIFFLYKFGEKYMKNR